MPSTQTPERLARMRQRRADPAYRKARNEKNRVKRENLMGQYERGKHPIVTYCVQDEHGRAKIGSTINLEYRVMLLQCGNADQLTVVGTRPGNEEHEIRQEFLSDQIRGEWFRLTDTLRAKFRDQNSSVDVRVS